MSTLYVVSTPIGNLQDLTHRAEAVLASVDRVLAEDTRRTGRLLEHLGIRKPLVSLHAHNEASRVERVLEWLAAGEAIALVSDAGTPLVSDPGRRLIDAVLAGGHRLVPVPGASAPMTALVASGLPADRFTFLGFVPRKGRERRSTLERVAGSAETTVLFESPERLGPLLHDLTEACGGDRTAAVARELTKLHEEVVRGTLAELTGYYEEHPPRGEVTLVVAAAEGRADEDGALEARARTLARSLLAEGGSPSRVAREVAERTGMPRNDAYTLVQDVQPMPSSEGEGS
jgi:16S rRNA (cytidine1402-2'-O)-methyltransferase